MTYPALPAETTYTDIELDLIANEPPGAFPEDQNSYWGQMRKVFADYIQANSLDLFNAWYNNLDPRVVDENDISEWEEMVGVPGDRTGLSLPARRSFVQNRLVFGAFSRSLVNRIVENFITATFGVPATFTPAGIPFDAGGITLFSGVSGDPKTMYRVYFDYFNRTYTVYVLNTIGEDLVGLTRELKRITPAGWTLVISDQANVLRYASAVLNDAPNGYWRMGTVNDASGFGQTMTAQGGVTVGGVAAGGLLANVTVSGNEGATAFDGVDDFFSSSVLFPLIKMPRFTFEAWVKPAIVPVSPNGMVFAATGSRYIGMDTAGGILRWVFTAQPNGVQTYVRSLTPTITAGATYHIVGTYDGANMKLYVNGALVATQAATGTATFDSAGVGTFQIGRYTAGSAFTNGTIDEVAVYDKALTAAQVLTHYNAGINVA